MRVAIIAKSKRHTRIYHYFKKAFQRQGHRTLWIKYSKLKSYLGDRLARRMTEKILTARRTDLLFFHGRDLPYGLLVRLKQRMPAVMYYDDCIRGSGARLDEVIRFGRLADAMYLTNRGEVSIYRRRGVNARFITGGCDAHAHRRVRAPAEFYRSEVAFIGKPNTAERVELMQAVSRRFDLKLWGAGWERFGLKPAARHVYAAGYRKICAGAKIILGWNIDPGVELYFSNRTWYTLGCGGFLLTLYSPRLEELFGRAKHLDWFTSIEECCRMIDYYLVHEQQRLEIAAAGCRLAHEKYSYERMVARIMDDMFAEGRKP